MDVTGNTLNYELAPIVLFAFDRPDHTLQTLKALSKNTYSELSTLYIYCDGPKNNASKEQLSNITKVRKIAKSEGGNEKNGKKRRGMKRRRE